MGSSRDDCLRLLQFNAENLFIFLDQHDGSPIDNLTEGEWQSRSSAPTPNKSLKKTWAIAEIIRENNPHFVLLNEVGGLESLKNFNHYFLKDQYKPYLIEGNSDRGIDVGYLVRSDLPLKYLLLTHKNRPLVFSSPRNMEKLPRPYHYFARDVAELRVFKENQNSPSLVIFLAHLKSKLDPEGIDPGGKMRREAEVQTFSQIYKEVQEELEGRVPIVLAGDFNGQARRGTGEVEFEFLFKNTNLIDIFDAIHTPATERFTQIQFPESGTPVPLQLDYIFVSPDLVPRVKKESKVFRFKGDLGMDLPPPKSVEQRYSLPSDHYPVLLCLENFLF